MELTDKVFLSKVVELYQLVHIDELMLLIDTHDTIIFAGNKITNIINIDVASLIGRNHLEILPLPQENIVSIKESIAKVIQTKSTQEFLTVNLNHTSNYLVLYCILKPIINPTTSNILAISVESKKLNAAFYLYKLLLFIENRQIEVNYSLPHNDELLTLREHEIAFLLFYCKSTKKVAAILSNLYDKAISAKTISNIISGSLYPKLQAYGIDALLERLHSLGYHNKIPVSFLINTHLDLN